MKSRMVLLVCLTSLLMTPARAEQDRNAGIASLLQRRADAVNSADRAAFMATSSGTEGFIATQGRTFDGLVSLKVKDYSLKLDLRDWPDLTRAKDKDAFGSQTVVAYVSERYRIEGVDEQPTWNDLFLTFAVREGGWKVVADDGVEDLGLHSSRQLWDSGPITTSSSAHYLLISHPDKAGQAEALLALAEEAVPLVPQAWPGAEIGRIPLVTPTDKQELKRLLGATFDVSNFVAFAASSTNEEAADGWQLVGHRIILNPVNFARHSVTGRRVILAHELVHIATRPQSGPFIPAFVDEGVAELTDPSRTASLRARARAGRFDRRLPEDWEFTAGGGDAIFNSYLEAASAIDYMKRRWGIEAVKTFYAKIGSVRSEAGTGRYHLDKALQEVVGVGAVEFEEAWAASVSGGGG